MQKLLLVFYHSENALQAKSGKYFQTWFSPRFGGKNGGVLSMRMQVILDSSFARPGSVPIWGGKKGEFRDWTSAAGDGVICSKNRKIVPYHGANPNTRNGARLRSPSLIMAPVLKYIKEFKTKCEFNGVDSTMYREIHRSMAVDFLEDFGPKIVQEPGKDKILHLSAILFA